MLVNQFAEKVWVSVNVQPGRAPEVLLIVETELPLNPQQEDFHPAHYNELVAAVDVYVASSSHYNRAVIIPLNRPKSAASGWKVRFENPFEKAPPLFSDGAKLRGIEGLR